jgi:hypothetical protein
MDAGGIQSRGVTEPQRDPGAKPLADKLQFTIKNIICAPVPKAVQGRNNYRL